MIPCYVTLIGETVEIVQTKTSTYVGTIVTEDASNVDENDDTFPCIIVEPVNDKRVEIWIPLASIQSRNVILYAD